MTSPDQPGDVETRREAEALERDDATELRLRAARIRERSKELIAELGPDHPLVHRALERAAALEAEADTPGQIHLR